jgi:hypothetical protein
VSARAANVSRQLRLAGFTIKRNRSREGQGVHVSQVGDDVRVRFDDYMPDQLDDLRDSIAELLRGKGYVAEGMSTLWVRRPA